MKKIYLAVPYSGIEEFSFDLSNIVAYKIMQEGYLVTAPVSMAHPIVNAKQKDKISDILGTWEYWEELDKSLIDWSDEVWVIRPNLSLTNNSKGVNGEISHALETNKPVKYIEIGIVEEYGVRYNSFDISKIDLSSTKISIILPE